MSEGRRVGRVQKIAYDATPLNSPFPDVAARIGWLLAMSRLHHPDPAFGDGRHFTEALAATGLTASRSLVSRWESGAIPVSYEGMSAYERVLSLETGQLSSITGYVRSAIPGLRAKVIRPQLNPAERAFGTRLDELIDLAEDGNALARDWQELGWHLAAAPLVHLRAATWESLTRQVVTLLPRSLKVPYRQYSTAAMNIASVPRAQDFLTSAIADYISRPGVQVLSNPIGLLDRLPTRESAKIVLDLVEDPPMESAFRLAVWLAAQKLERGDFTAEERGRLDMIVLRLWRANPAQAADDLAELIASLPEGLRSTLTAAATKAGSRKLGYVVEAAEDLAPGVARQMSRDLAAGVRAEMPGNGAYDEDRMLVRLIREAMFHRDSERRHLAALLMSASPFREVVTDGLLDLLGRGDVPPLIRARAATLTRYLSTESHRLRLLRFVQDPVDDVRVVVLEGLGHMVYSEVSDQAIRSSLGEDWSAPERAKLYALGMTGSPGLRAILRSSTAPSWQKTAATWWLAEGPAVRT